MTVCHRAWDTSPSRLVLVRAHHTAREHAMGCDEPTAACPVLSRSGPGERREIRSNMPQEE